MLIDTHCHINTMVKKEFDKPLTTQELQDAKAIIDEAEKNEVSIIFNVGTSIIESKNCIELSSLYKNNYAIIGIHPNDLTSSWKSDIKELKKLLVNHPKVIGIGECGIDKHYPDYNMQQQIDAFHAQIELALAHNKPIVVHSRDAYDETLKELQKYKNDKIKGIMHCFSYDYVFAQEIIELGFVLGIGGTITYPKNEDLRSIVQKIDLDFMVLETDAPFLPPQIIRGQRNHPKYIKYIGEYIAQLKNIPFTEAAQKTTETVQRMFNIST